jgi:MYXO-CTERM domain-containing protein
MTVAATALGLVAERDASACGGCFHPPTQNVSDITDERMLLAVSTTQTTLYDQIRYSGSPSSFAWVLPIHGTVDVGLSADVLFDSIDGLTETKIIPPEQNCPPPPNCGGSGSSTATATGSTYGAAGSVTVLKQQNVGPYATVQLQSTDPSALNNWLAQNGFVIPADVTPVIDEYVTEGFNFLAMKLLPDQGVQAMRPVRVTTAGASFSLPLRMAAIGTGASVGITIWVVADGRYEPQNFPSFRIQDSQLVWDFAASISNYTTLRVQNEASLGNKAWEIESSIALNEQLITNVINSGGQIYGTYGGGVGPSYVSDPSQDYLAMGNTDAGPDAGETPEQVRADDVAALFAGMAGPTVRVTRMRSDIIHSAMTADLVLQAASDQSELTNVRNVTRSVNLVCPVYSACPVGVSTGASTPVGTSGSSTARGAYFSPTGGTGSGGGCAAAPQSSPGGPLALAGILGLAVLGASRRRKTQQGRKS